MLVVLRFLPSGLAMTPLAEMARSAKKRLENRPETREVWLGLGLGLGLGLVENGPETREAEMRRPARVAAAVAGPPWWPGPCPWWPPSASASASASATCCEAIEKETSLVEARRTPAMTGTSDR